MRAHRVEARQGPLESLGAFVEAALRRLRVQAALERNQPLVPLGGKVARDSREAALRVVETLHARAEQGAKRMLELTLRAGDTLYLPRGWLHDALTSASDSLHITVGVNVYTWIDALRAAVESLADDVELRRSVAADGEATVAVAERLAQCLTPEEVARRMRRRFVRLGWLVTPAIFDPRPGWGGAHVCPPPGAQ